MTTDPIRIPTSELLDGLRAFHETQDYHRQAAAAALIGYNDGELLGKAAVRAHIETGTHAGPDSYYVNWRSLADDLDQLAAGTEAGFDRFARLSSSAIDTLRFACALALPDRPMPLSGITRWGQHNRRVMLAAFALAVGVPDVTIPPAQPVDTSWMGAPAGVLNEPGN